MNPEFVINRIRDAVMSLLRQQGGALTHELVLACGGAAQGSHMLCMGDPNFVLWTGVSEEFCAAMLQLFDQLEIHRAAPNVASFFSDELGVPPFKLISAQDWARKQAGEDLHLASPHWMPAVFFLKEPTCNTTS